MTYAGDVYFLNFKWLEVPQKKNFPDRNKRQSSGMRVSYEHSLGISIQLDLFALYAM